MTLALHALVALATLVAMEPLVVWIHRHVMHGQGWRWHRSHHEAEGGWWEKNDLYALVAAGAAVLCFSFGGISHWLWWVGLGMTLYGLLYALVHDGLVHRRFPLPRFVPRRYLKRLIDAHHLHHAVRGREGSVSFGFLYAPPTASLRRELAMRRATPPDRPETSATDDAEAASHG